MKYYYDSKEKFVSERKFLAMVWLMSLPDLRLIHNFSQQNNLDISRNNSPTVNAVLIELLRQEAQTGNPTAMLALGAMYYAGRGVATDYDTGFDWFLKAAEAGNPEAMFRTGLAVVTGCVGKLSDEETTQWLLKAAKLKHREAMRLVAIAYHRGDGVPEDSKEYKFWMACYDNAMFAD